MKTWLRKIYQEESFYPTWFIGVWINPCFIIRRALVKQIQKVAFKFVGGSLLDVGCGSKPYRSLFTVDEYIGIDVDFSGHDHKSSRVDKYYDGCHIPFADNKFNWVFSSEVFQVVFNLDELLNEINRVLVAGGKLAFTSPFVWDEHEQPCDYARYTSFALRQIISRHGFVVESLSQSTTYFETVMQMLAAYISEHILPTNPYLKLALNPLLVAPISIIGSLLGPILPNGGNFYHNNIVIARKIDNIIYFPSKSSTGN